MTPSHPPTPQKKKKIPYFILVLIFFCHRGTEGVARRALLSTHGCSQGGHWGSSGSTSWLLQGFGLGGISPESLKLLWQPMGSLKVVFFHPKRLLEVTGGP